MSGFYFDWANYRKMLELVRQEPDRARRRSLYRTFLLVVPGLAVVHAVCFALDPLVFPALRRTEVTAPVFSVGHARSGTTHLHRLMAADEQFSSFLLYEMFFPSLIEKRLLRAVLRVDKVVFKGRLRRRIDKLDERLFGASKGMHDTGLFAAEEDDFVLTFSCASGFWMILLPYMGKLDFYYVDEWSERKRRRTMEFYRECLRRQVHLNGPSRTHLSKNPTFCGRVESLIETFPDARFVVLVRDPSETVPSLLKLMQTAWGMRQRDESQVRDALRVLAEQSFHSYEHPLEVLAAHPEVRSVVVDYRDLVQDPQATVRHVYDELELTLTPQFAQALAAAQGRTHASTHEYSLEEFGLDPDEIHTRLAPLFERFGWDDRKDARVH